MPGWFASLSSTPQSTLAATTGTDFGPGIYSLGSPGQSDRTLGGFAGSPNLILNYGLLLVNSTGATIPHFSVSFTLKQWYLGTAGSETLALFYKTGNNLTFNASNGWVEVADLNTSSPATGGEGLRNGNLAENQAVVTIHLANVNLAAGQQLFLKWQDMYPKNKKDSDHGLGIDDVRILPLREISFYAKPNSALNNLSSWGTNPDGTGSSPEAFTADNQVFYIHHPNPSLTKTWVVSGANARVVLGDGQNPVSLATTSRYYLQAPIDLSQHASLTLVHPTLPTLGAIHPNSTLIFQTTTDHVLAASSLGNLTLSGSGTKTLAGHTTLAGSLILNGARLALKEYNLRLAPTATITGGSASSFILTDGSGALERLVPANNLPVSFPVGNPTYTPAELSQSPAGSSDYFRVRVFPGAYSAYDEQDQPLGERLIEKAIDRTWIVDEALDGGSDVTLKLFWSAAEVLPNYKNQENQISHCDNGVWNKTLPKAAIPSLGSMYANSMSGITTFSPFISNTPDARLVDLTTLPVRLLSFTATRLQQQIRLSWSTAMEQNNNYFAVEVSTDGRNFRQTGQVKGAGNSQQVRAYSFLYRPASTGLSYFRLRQTDLDGQVTYSAIVAVDGQPAPAAFLQVFPNPGAGLYQLGFPEGEEPPQIQVSDLSGKQVLPWQPLPAGRGPASLDLRSQPPGIYLLTVVRGDARQAFRLVKN
ncbi:MAG: T9SS type A sorting domain-containing protein [Adhaeribacter sp.]